MLGSAMLNRIMRLFTARTPSDEGEAGQHTHDELQLAAAALLVEAAAMDEDDARLGRVEILTAGGRESVLAVDCNIHCQPLP